ncbi:hypothetical protein BJY04DRAFT_190573 [Aspergillus karnatakaensis]|uniref:uncharacterized protein n=1 Tax=Aspergillus karnatakaensis TaxID=1810916 RepID=UPI003CCE3400
MSSIITIVRTLLTLLSLICTLALAAPSAIPELAPATNTSTIEERAAHALSCQDDGTGYRPVSEAINLIRLFNKKGQTLCGTPQGGPKQIIFAAYESTAFVGEVVNGKKDAQSICWDVIRAFEDIINTCTTSAGWVGGSNTAHGNGDLLVRITKYSPTRGSA